MSATSAPGANSGGSYGKSSGGLGGSYGAAPGSMAAIGTPGGPNFFTGVANNNPGGAYGATQQATDQANSANQLMQSTPGALGNNGAQALQTGMAGLQSASAAQPEQFTLAPMWSRAGLDGKSYFNGIGLTPENDPNNPANAQRAQDFFTGGRPYYGAVPLDGNQSWWTDPSKLNAYNDYQSAINARSGSVVRGHMDPQTNAFIGDTPEDTTGYQQNVDANNLRPSWLTDNLEDQYRQYQNPDAIFGRATPVGGLQQPGPNGQYMNSDGTPFLDRAHSGLEGINWEAFTRNLEQNYQPPAPAPAPAPAPFTGVSTAPPVARPQPRPAPAVTPKPVAKLPAPAPRPAPKPVTVKPVARPVGVTPAPFKPVLTRPGVQPLLRTAPKPPGR